MDAGRKGQPSLSGADPDRSLESDPDRLLLRGTLLMAAVCWHVQMIDLDGVANALRVGVDDSTTSAVSQQLGRCALLGELAERQLGLALVELDPMLDPPPGGSVSPASLAHVAEHTAELWQLTCGEPLALRAWHGQLSRIASSVRLSASALGVLSARDGLITLQLASALLELGDPTAGKDATQPPTNDELIFFVAHQLFEVLLPACNAALAKAVRLVRDGRQPIWKAVSLVRRAAAQLARFADMITVPMTMPASECAAFRTRMSDTTRTGSAAFRSLELLLGRNGPTSLHTAIVAAFCCRGITVGANREDAVRVLARVLADPTRYGVDDLVDLAEAALDVEDNLIQWRTRYITMVRRILGERPTRGPGGHLSSVGELPYLTPSVDYGSCLPELREARRHIH